MKIKFYLIAITILLFSCGKDQRTVEKIEFKSPYAFTSELENRLAKDSTQWKHQYYAVEFAQNGNYKRALQEWDLAMGFKAFDYSADQIDSINKLYTKVNARNYIIEKAKDHRIIIINEAHHNSLNRNFTTSLLKDLYALGYTHLGLEALVTSDSLTTALNNRMYPTQEDGYYIKEPRFGNMVRSALELGYNVFPYDTITQGDQNIRESVEAKNIQQVMEANPNEKFLIHCGYAHAYEGEDKSWVVTMAQRLKDNTGLDPLTISQTNYIERGNVDFNHPLLKAIDINEATVLLDQNNNPFKLEQRGAYTDLAIFHPNTNYIDNRPDWLFENDNKPVSIDLSDITIDYPVMVLAYQEGEEIDKAVPVDIVNLETPGTCTLGLTKGTYEIVITNGKESFKFNKNVK